MNSTLRNIEMLRKKNGLRQIDVTDYLNISKGVYTDWLAGRSESYVRYIDQLAELFDVSTDFLLGRDERVAEIDPRILVGFLELDGYSLSDLSDEDIKKIQDYVKLLIDSQELEKRKDSD